ncbi:hypothetical protein [Nocardia kruczakiae]|uniref:hypothetical protein n=1 Tax=Nocardia kruczakiae TaxID=261477 RepID=UPI0012EE7B34|nr:hypothetical protein [Nocardia kruczakiae]
MGTGRRFRRALQRSRLSLPLGIALAEHLPAGLRALYTLADQPQFGDLEFYAHQVFGPQRLIDSAGEVIDAGNTLTIGQAQEQSIVLDLDTWALGIRIFTALTRPGARHGGWPTRGTSTFKNSPLLEIGPMYRSSAIECVARASEAEANVQCGPAMHRHQPGQ